MKMLVVFEKTPRLRHIGHLDLLRTIQRSLRRSGLPIKYSQGYNPHMLMSFAAPLSLGHAALREVMEVPLEESVPEERFRLALQACLPEDIILRDTRAVEDDHKSPMALLTAARYRIRFPEDPVPSQAEIDAFLSRETIPVMKKTKTKEQIVDIKPMIHELAVRDDAVYATLSLTEAASCKPELLLSAFYGDRGVPRVLVTRLCLFGEAGGCLVPLEML